MSIIVCMLLALACTHSSFMPTVAVTEDSEHFAEADEPGPVLPPPGPARNLQMASGEYPEGIYAYTDPGELPQLTIVEKGVAAETMPLEHTDVSAEVRGHVAQVRVRQRFRNLRTKPIEVSYTFPLPENAAVDAMRMIVGRRVIESEVQTREQARDTYVQAVSQGHTAALLEQERPNIFTQSLANIPPGEAIEVEISYLQTLSQDGGEVEFVFPMVVGPRFGPPGQEAEAARISPPVVGKGERSGNDVSLALTVQSGKRIDQWRAATHRVVGEATAEGFAVRLADAETIPNRDFVIRWQAAQAKTAASLFLGPVDAKGWGHFSLLVEPPAADLDALVGRREMIFVVDRSGSMSGQPLALAKQALREALGRLRPVDTFDVVGFEGGVQRLFAEPRPANEQNLVLAERFIDGMVAGGGTMMAGAVEAALAPEIAPGRHRYVFFLTDGYISNEQEIYVGTRELLERAAAGGQRSRVFGMGIGSSSRVFGMGIGSS
ncbi:MAG: VWA domain-containing protein, partial [Myxococcales bacterium]|nr:VWA domain-containing protein [Myxococcales bacterium]